MKELTIQEKAKAYDKAIKVIKDNLDALNEITETGANIVNIQSIQNCFYKAFPELKESDDEMIRKEILNYIDKATGCKRWVAWLEKQGNTNIFDVPKISIKNAVEVTSRMQYIDEDIKPIAEFIMDYANWNLHKDEWNKPTLTVPLFRVLDALIQKGKPYCGCNQNIEKQGEHNTADKAEPKFNVGDWVTDNNEVYFQIVSYVNHIYKLESVEGTSSHFNKEFIESKFRLCTIDDAKRKDDNDAEPKFKVDDWVVGKYPDDGSYIHKVVGVKRLDDGTYVYALDDNTYFSGSQESFYSVWTIQDANDGEVLVNGSNIFIFHFINDTRLMGYCHVNTDDRRFYDDIGKNECFCLIDAVVNPATKEQCDLLFQKMKEAGYEWDAEKKELKKIRQKPTWSEEDESNFQGIIDVIKKNKQHVTTDYEHQIYYGLLSWFKSLKERYTWKLSDKQMKICKEVYADLLSAKGFDIGTINSELNRLEEKLK